MSLDVIDAETEADRLYNKGFDDGYEGRSKASDHPSYLEGYFDGQDEGDETDFYDGGFNDYWNDLD